VLSGRTRRHAKRQTVDEEDLALDTRLMKCGWAMADICVMTKNDKKEMLMIVQESQQVAQVNQERRKAFCKEADINYEVNYDTGSTTLAVSYTSYRCHCHRKQCR
jgi:thiaminase